MEPKSNVIPLRPGDGAKAPAPRLEMLGQPIDGFVLVEGWLPYALALALGAVRIEQEHANV